MRFRLGLTLLLAAPVACFSEPPGSSTSSDDASGNNSATGAEGSGSAGPTDSTSTATTEQSGTSFSSTSAGATSLEETGDVTTGGRTSGIADTGTPGTELVLYDLFDVACTEGVWISASAGAGGPSPAPCYEDKGVPQTQGAIRKLGGDSLILELPDGDEGFLSGTFFELPSDVTSEGAARLRFEVACVHPKMIGCAVEAIQFLVYSSGEETPSTIPFDEPAVFGPGMAVDVPIVFGGRGDQLVIAAFADMGIPGQAIALRAPRIVVDEG